MTKVCDDAKKEPSMWPSLDDLAADDFDEDDCCGSRSPDHLVHCDVTDL